MTSGTLGLKFHHVGVGVLDMQGAIRTYEALGHRLLRSVDDPGINIRVAFLANPSAGPWIELLAPLNPHGPLESLIKRKLLPSPYHTGYGVDHLDLAGERLREEGFIQLGAAREAVAFDGARVAFHYHDIVGLIELIERPPEWRAQRLASVSATAGFI
jgi:catechol 2,3-dioxygenase-like lactoylglutathione lyase family enzyme